MTPIVRRNAIYIGNDAATGERTYLNLKWLQEKNVHVIGPPGEGKTRWLLHLFQCLCRIPRASVVLMNPKGALARMARDWALANGLTPRVTWFDPGDPAAVIGYNPLQPNGLHVHAHAKAVRESIRSAWGQESFDATPRIAKYLFLSLAVARLFEWGLVEALQILRPGAPLRRQILPRIGDPFLRESLESLDGMNRNLQEDRVESCISRLEAFLCDPVIAAMLTAPRSLDLGQVIAGHRILLVNLEIRRPLALDDVRLLGRMLLNDIASHVFARPAGDKSPVYFILDECHQFLTQDFTQLLDMGRELGCHVIAAHQHLDQLRQEDESRRIYGSVMKSARVKVIFGDCAAEDLDILLRDAMIDQFDNMKVKDEIRTLQLEPVESVREVTTSGRSLGGSLGMNKGTSAATARGRSHSVSRQSGTSEAHGDTISSAQASGVTSALMNGETVLPNGDIVTVANAGDGASEVNISGQAFSDSYGSFESFGTQDTHSETKTAGTQAGVSASVNRNQSESKSLVPFYEYKKTETVTSRTFETEQEFLTKCLQKAKAQPVGHYLLKLPKRPALFIRGPFVHDPQITTARRAANLARVHAQPCYELRNAPPAVPSTPLFISKTSAPYQIPRAEVESPEAPPPTKFWE